MDDSSKDIGGLHGLEVCLLVFLFLQKGKVELPVLIHLVWLIHKSLNIVSNYAYYFQQ